MLAAIASSTGLRPATHSAPEPGRPVWEGRNRRPGPALPEPRPELSDGPGAGATWLVAFLARCAAWYGRSSALGVGPLPSRPRRTRPPEPALLDLPLRRTAPLRWLLPGIRRPSSGGLAACPRPRRRVEQVNPGWRRRWQNPSVPARQRVA